MPSASPTPAPSPEPGRSGSAGVRPGDLHLSIENAAAANAAAATGATRAPSGCLPGWTTVAVLKQDLFSRVERGHFTAADPPGEWVLRDARVARGWACAVAWWLARREAAALAAVAGLRGVPQLRLARDRRILRSWIEGAPMQVARPRDRAWYRAARRLLVALHRRGVAHNDLAKEANWIVAADGSPAFVDFQLAWVAKRRGRWFRIAAREDLRHLLKHKRSYCPEALTDRERRILATRSWPARLWMATGKRVYLFVTRRLLDWEDREGASERQFPAG